MGKKDKQILIQQGKAENRQPFEYKSGLAELINAAQRDVDRQRRLAGERERAGKRGMFDEFAQYKYKPRLGDIDEFGQMKAQMVEKLMREVHERRMLGIMDQDRELDMLSQISRLSQGNYELARKSSIDPNSANGLEELMREALSKGLGYPFVLCMTQRTWSEFISPDAKEFIVQQMDEGALEVVIDSSAPDKAIYLREKE